MKVLLVSVNNERGPYPVAPLGAACVAAALKKDRHDVRILDLCFAEDDNEALSTALTNYSPEIIGFSIRNIDNLTYNKSVFYMPRLKGIIDRVKELTSAPLVAGGAGFSIFPGEVLRYLELDMGIIGEGETAFSRLVGALARNQEISDIPNLCFYRNGQFISNAIGHEKKPGRPDRSLLDNASYLQFGGMGNIQSKRGCPFACAYCTYPSIEGSLLRLRDPAEVAEELAEMETAYGVDHVFFVDDIFNFPEDHAAAVCEEMLRVGVKADWTCFATPRGLSRELTALMKKAGCKGVEFGSDAGSDRTLKGLGKSFKVEDIARAVEHCRSVSLPNAHYVIIGGPEENESTLQETFSLFETIRPTAVIALVGVRVYPDTKLHERAVQEQVLGEDTCLLEPAFYLTPQMDASSLFRQVSAYARQRPNWIVPGLGIRCEADMLSFLRKMGRKGPLWDMLPAEL